ncbi:MAG: Gfo/Idh/MocA family oxidoreductase [Alphaproteobacteria bacterium]|nr:Gfo/Idh/MocA family oxidoreductase [Alphaproteobacteria bacterium]
MQAPVRVAVIGVGYFGRIHAMKYATNPRAELVGVVDCVAERASAVAAELGCAAYTHHRELLGRIDAASIATPTSKHFEIGSDLLQSGIDLLVEKPMSNCLASAIALADVAAAAGRILQIGHIERYSSAVRTLIEQVSQPLYIESYRIAPWRERGVDVDVILDLMIHDIDIVLALANSPVVSVDAVGAPVLGNNIDLANARLSFESGCVATITASRVSHKIERSIRIYQAKCYTVADLHHNQIYSYRLQGDVGALGAQAVASETRSVAAEDSLANEIDDFLECVVHRRKPIVGASAGIEAVRLASLINESIARRSQAASASIK